MSKIIHQFSKTFEFFSSQSRCEAFVKSQNPSNLYEVEKLIFDYVNSNHQ
jgi:hypothetical protein